MESVNLKSPLRPVEAWKVEMEGAIGAMLDQMLLRSGETHAHVSDTHLSGTPSRVVRAYEELFSGVGKDPRSVLHTSFNEERYDQMIIVDKIDFVSVCAHHLLPFHGFARFAYLPDKKVVGLSKIPRMIEILAHRPQIQERLTDEIVALFHDAVHPLGCGVVLDAWHSCVSTRGVHKSGVRMRTISLRGCFREPDVKAEFLNLGSKLGD